MSIHENCTCLLSTRNVIIHLVTCDVTLHVTYHKTLRKGFIGVTAATVYSIKEKVLYVSHQLIVQFIVLKRK